MKTVLLFDCKGTEMLGFKLPSYEIYLHQKALLLESIQNGEFTEWLNYKTAKDNIGTLVL